MYEIDACMSFYNVLDCLIIQNNLITGFSYSAAISLKKANTWRFVPNEQPDSKNFMVKI